jgi:predicted DNA-binding transcriptional regulator AlpA
MKLEIRFDQQEIEQIVQRLTEILSNSWKKNTETRVEEWIHQSKKPQPQTTWKMPDGEWWSEKEVAKVIGISVHTLRNWRFSGKGPTYQKIGRRILYPKSDVLEFMNSLPKIRRRD